MTRLMHLLLALAMCAVHLSCAANLQDEKIDAYAARFGRLRPVIAVVGENSSTVLSDYVIPYAILARSGLAEVRSVATHAGVLRLPPLTIKPDSSTEVFDGNYPDGADYVIVPAVMKHDDPALLAWLVAQAAKGATMVSICNGSMVLANAGLTRGHRATGHWSTYKKRVANHPDTLWIKNRRYVADGKLVSSAGITAAIPVSLALVEAIGGAARADAMASELGVDYRGPRHDSDAFHLTAADGIAAIMNTVFHVTQDVGVPVAAGVDEIALSLTADAYEATLRSRILAVSASSAPVRTRSGLMLVPDRVAGQGKRLDLMLPALGATPSARVAEQLLKDVTLRYGAAAARLVRLEWEYPWLAQ